MPAAHREAGQVLGRPGELLAVSRAADEAPHLRGTQISQIWTVAIPIGIPLTPDQIGGYTRVDADWALVTECHPVLGPIPRGSPTMRTPTWRHRQDSLDTDRPVLSRVRMSASGWPGLGRSAGKTAGGDRCGSSQHGRVRPPSTDDLQAHGQARAPRADGYRGGREAGEVGGLGQRAPGIARLGHRHAVDHRLLLVTPR